MTRPALAMAALALLLPSAAPAQGLPSLPNLPALPSVPNFQDLAGGAGDAARRAAEDARGVFGAAAEQARAARGAAEAQAALSDVSRAVDALRSRGVSASDIDGRAVARSGVLSGGRLLHDAPPVGVASPYGGEVRVVGQADGRVVVGMGGVPAADCRLLLAVPARGRTAGAGADETAARANALRGRADAADCAAGGWVAWALPAR